MALTGDQKAVVALDKFIDIQITAIKLAINTHLFASDIPWYKRLHVPTENNCRQPVSPFWMYHLWYSPTLDALPYRML